MLSTKIDLLLTTKLDLSDHSKQSSGSYPFRILKSGQCYFHKLLYTSSSRPCLFKEKVILEYDALIKRVKKASDKSITVMLVTNLCKISCESNNTQQINCIVSILFLLMIKYNEPKLFTVSFDLSLQSLSNTFT